MLEPIDLVYFVVQPKSNILNFSSQTIDSQTIATIATDKLTLIAYKAKNPKKAHIARA
jgi:hypothetical protein